MGVRCTFLRTAYAAMRPLWPLRSHARTSVIPRAGSANADHACSPGCDTWEYQGHPQSKWAENQF